MDTPFGREGSEGSAPMGHAFGVRVQKVQKVLPAFSVRVQKVEVAAAPQFYSRRRRLI